MVGETVESVDLEGYMKEMKCPYTEIVAEHAALAKALHALLAGVEWSLDNTNKTDNGFLARSLTEAGNLLGELQIRKGWREYKERPITARYWTDEEILKAQRVASFWEVPDAT